MEEPENFTGLNASTNITGLSLWETGKLEFFVFMISFIFGFPAHCYMLWFNIRGAGGGVASEFFNLNLSACGFLFVVSSFFFMCSKWFPLHSITTLTQFFFGLVIAGRPLFQCLMCVERYLAVVHPVIFLKYKPLRYRVICSVFVWIVNIASCVTIPLFIYYSYIELFFGFVLVQLVLFLSIQIFCCVSVLRALKQSGPGERRRDRDEENLMKRRAFIIILLTGVSLVIMYVPLSITVLLLLMKWINIQTVWLVCYVCFMVAGLCLPAHFLHRTGKLSCCCSPT